MYDLNNKSYSEILDDWEKFKKTPAGKIYVIMDYPMHLIRGVLLFLLEVFTHRWLKIANKKKMTEMEIAYNINKQINFNNKIQKASTYKDVSIIKRLIEEEKNEEAIIHCEELLERLNNG